MLHLPRRVEWHCNFTKYCASHANWLSGLIRVTYETLFTMRGATKVTLQHHQILRLPRKLTLMIDPRHIWNLIYNARSNRGYPPTSSNSAPATQNDSHDWSASHMKHYLQCVAQQRCLSNITHYCACHAKCLSWLILVTYETLFTMRGATEVTLQHHQILRLPGKILKLRRNFSKAADVIYNAGPIRPAIIPNFTKCCTCHEEWHCNFTKYCASHANWLSGLIRVTYETSCTMCGATKVTLLQHHQILRLPRKLALMIDPRHIWNLIYNARSNRGYPPTSSNSAPATQNDSHDWSASHMKRYLQCVEQQRCLSNITHYCACHAKWLSWLILVTYETLITLRGATKVTFQHHQILRLPRKLALMIDPRHIWNLIYNARSNRGYPPTSSNSAPATQNDSHDWSASHMKRYLQCVEQQRCLSNITHYCACHAKWLSWLILVTYETLFTLRGATKVTLQHHQILRLPRKLTLQNFKEICRKQVKRHLQCGAGPRMIWEFFRTCSGCFWGSFLWYMNPKTFWLKSGHSYWLTILLSSFLSWLSLLISRMTWT